ncbi:hypothetical protein [Puia sp.]|jgi:hypothetical protein|uniref:hypothetical protein n=1 Tax=Puia sp. TaxID=2045100 RepID=UPI002F3F4213
MKPENFEQRQKLLRRFLFLYVGSLALLILGFWALSSREPAAVPVQNLVPTAEGRQKTDRITAELDSSRQQVWRLRRELLTKDSLIDQLVMAPVPDIPDGAYERHELARLQKEQLAARDALRKIRYDSALLREQLDDQVRAGSGAGGSMRGRR